MADLICVITALGVGTLVYASAVTALLVNGGL